MDDALGGHLVDQRLRSAQGRLRRAVVGAVTALRSPFRPVRSFERSWRLASRRLMFCRFALSADLFRFATY